jgi:hypothetical protein
MLRITISLVQTEPILFYFVFDLKVGCIVLFSDVGDVVINYSKSHLVGGMEDGTLAGPPVLLPHFRLSLATDWHNFLLDFAICGHEVRPNRWGHLFRL